MPTAASKPRRQFRNIHVTQIVGYRFPAPAIVSILHRISGALLFFVGLPYLLYLFQESLTSELSFEHYRSIIAHPLAKLVLLALVWAYVHHLIAGLRHLAMDLDIANDREQALLFAKVQLALSVVITAVLGLKLFGAF